MKYIKARKKINSGDVLVWSGNSWFSKIIKWWTKSEYTHVGIAWKAHKRLFTIEAMDLKGIQICPLSKRLPFYWIKTNIKWNAKLSEIAFEHIGDKYSVMECIRTAAKLPCKRDRKWHCVEFVTFILEKANIILPSKRCVSPKYFIHSLLDYLKVEIDFVE